MLLLSLSGCESIALLLLEFFEQLFIGRLLNQVIDGLNVALLWNVDAPVLLSNTIPSMEVNDGARRAARSHSLMRRSTFHFLLSHAHPVLM
ncbi:hypothetical protein AC579_6425 [Pseudocercospora musae]|uniref:Uncharacterized protein n=1 Tax=Pseudocercospora musae TaxID=113226 RepID=A0A139I4B3_9PEZI|nr:hypothetical protein AC579_6425 [Pseudocercospora musae]